MVTKKLNHIRTNISQIYQTGRGIDILEHIVGVFLVKRF